jgi:hypothetical protein
LGLTSVFHEALLTLVEGVAEGWLAMRTSPTRVGLTG